MRGEITYLPTEARIPGRPVPWARTATVGGKRVNPEGYRNWRAHAADFLAAAARWRSFPEGREVAVTIDVHPDGVRVSAAALDPDDRRRRELRGDIDNYCKSVLDAMQAAGVFADDRVVADLHVRFNPRTMEER